MHLFLLLACSLGPSFAGTEPSVGRDDPLPATEMAPPVAALPPIAGDRYSLGARVTHGALAVWPVLDKRPSTTGDYLTLADGLAGGKVTVKETEGGTVPTLLVKNSTDTALLLVAGDIVTGGKQDRVIVADHVVPPRTEASVAVNCVEHGRWSEGSTFGYGGRAEYELKQAVEVDNNQGKTWEKVAELNDKKRTRLAAKGVKEDGLAPSTGSYRASLEAEGVRADAAPYEEVVRRAISGEGVVGLVVAFDGQVVGTELFGSPALLAANRASIAQGVARDAVSRGEGNRSAPPADAVALGYLDDTLAAPASAPEGTGGAVRATTDGEKTVGKDLREADGDLVHKSTYKK